MLKMVTVTYASTVNATSVNDTTAYERNIVVMQQLYTCSKLDNKNLTC